MPESYGRVHWRSASSDSPDAPVTATYDAAVATEFRVWLTAILVVLALVAVLGFIGVIGMFTGEYWCTDRSPWWGPPEDPNSTCAGLSWARDHPGEFPETLPK
jgi:hypothetical protein